MLCAVCQKKTETTCAACKSVHYCSRDCQKSDWKSHKKICGSFTIKKEEEEKDGVKLIRHSIVAAKNLNRGDRILEELPLFHIPRVPFLEQAKPEIGKKDYLLCVTCGANMSGFPNKRCSRCKWPVCGKNCEKHKIHAENECEALASKKITYDFLAVHEDHRILLICRAKCMKEKKPEVWNELMKRADEISKAGQDSVENRVEISKLEAAMKKLYISNEDMEMYKKFFGLLNLTSLRYDGSSYVDTPIGRKIKQSRVGDFLYPLFNYFSFSCAPNCNFVIDDSPTFKMHVRAARDIKKGEELTIEQGSVPLSEGTSERRLSIKNQFGYLCKCKRCSDPIEFGTFFSGIVCNACRPQGENPSQLEENVGYFLPLDPESTTEEEEEGKGGEDEKKEYTPLVQCNGCKSTRPYSFFKEQLSSIGKELDDNFAQNYELLDSSMKKAYTEREAAKMKKYLSKYSGKILHPNHFLMYKALSNLCGIYGQVLTFEGLGLDGMVKHKSMYEQCVHFLRARLELETPLFDGAFINHQAYDQSCIATAMHKLAQIQSMSRRYETNPLEGLEIKEKLKESILAFNLTFDFYTKYMPTTLKPHFDLDGLMTVKEHAEYLLGEFNKMFTVTVLEP